MFLTQFLDLRRVIIVQNYVTGGLLMCQGQFGKRLTKRGKDWAVVSFSIQNQYIIPFVFQLHT